jgi:hypothetical protein
VKAIRDRIAQPAAAAVAAPVSTTPAEKVEPAPVVAAPPVIANADADDEEDDDPDAPPVAGNGDAPAKVEDAQPAPDAELRSTVERQAAMIEKHRAEAETARKTADEATRAREQATFADEDAYLADPTAAVRSWLARSIGVKDAKDPAVEKELEDLIVDLIAVKNGVSLDPAHTAVRQSVRTQRSWEAEKRRRTGLERDASTQQRDQGSQAVQAARAEIARRLESTKDATPHLLALSMAIDGREPSSVVWEALQKGVANGTIDSNASEDAMFEQARSAAEKLYQVKADVVRGLKLGTAASSTPPDPQASVAAASVKDDKARQGHGPRTITNAAASVAPATSTQKPTEQPPLRHETDQERRARVWKKHAPNLPK